MPEYKTFTKGGFEATLAPSELRNYQKRVSDTRPPVEAAACCLIHRLAKPGDKKFTDTVAGRIKFLEGSGMLEAVLAECSPAKPKPVPEAALAPPSSKPKKSD